MFIKIKTKEPASEKLSNKVILREGICSENIYQAEVTQKATIMKEKLVGFVASC